MSTSEPLPIPRSRERQRVRNALARARAHSRPATLTLDEWLATVAHFNGRCAYCGTHRFTTLDHATPITRGGATSADNVLPCCRKCNDVKGELDLASLQQRLESQRIRRMVEHVRAARAYLKRVKQQLRLAIHSTERTPPSHDHSHHATNDCDHDHDADNSSSETQAGHPDA